MAAADGRGQHGDPIDFLQVCFHFGDDFFRFPDMDSFTEAAFNLELGPGRRGKEKLFDLSETDDGHDKQADDHGDAQPSCLDGHSQEFAVEGVELAAVGILAVAVAGILQIFFA